MPTQADLIVKTARRISEAIDSAEPCHQSICRLMGQHLNGATNDDDVMELMQLLQYYDRLQQRTHSLSGLIELVASERAPVAASIARFCHSAPVEDDALWLAQLYPQCVTAVEAQG